ncbi:MAG: PAS domain-containing sensor histidine kinase [Pseudomonadota bacterium]
MQNSGDRLERLILQSRNKFRALVDGLADEVMSIDPDYRIITVNKALASNLEKHPRELIGRRCHKIIYGFDRPCPENGLACPALLARQTQGVEVVFHELPAVSSHDFKYLEIRAMPLDECGKDDDCQDEGEVILARRDVTLQRLAEIQLLEHQQRLEKEVRERTQDLVLVNEELTAQRNELAEVNDSLLKLQAMKEDLTNMVVHDLKSPLAEILANLEMLGSEPLSEMQGEFLEAAHIGGDDLQRMITNLLDISRLEEDRLALDITDISVPDLLEETAARFALRARLGEVQLETSATPDLPFLAADQRLLERVLTNLLSNALDYTPAGGRILISASRQEGFLRFEVKDTGRGVPRNQFERIFEKFSQGQSGRPKTSSGLGLTFCRMAVETHGGRIWVESELERGSSFIFLLPLTEAPVLAVEDGND